MARTRAAEIAREVTEKELLGAALEVFVAKGYHSTTISDIVHAAGVTQGTFYLYFKNKADILSALMRQYREMMISGLFNVDLDRIRTREHWRILGEGISDFLIDHLRTHGDYMRLTVAESTTIGSAFVKESDAFNNAIVVEIERLLIHGLKMALINDLDVEAVSLSIFGALKEAIHQSTSGSGTRAPEEIIPRVIRAYAELLLK